VTDMFQGHSRNNGSSTRWPVLECESTEHLL